MSWHSKTLAALLATASLTAVSGCDNIYDPPPDATLVQPAGGAFTPGDVVQIAFSEPVKADTVNVRLWPNVRDIENEIAEGTEPIVASCGVGETCGELSVSLSRDRKLLTLVFDGELGKPGRPYAIELLPGLSDDEGNDTFAPYMWDMQFRAVGRENTEPVEFDNGVYILVAQVDKPLPAVLTLISDVRVLESGEFVLAGAEGDEINDAPKNTTNPEDLVVDVTDQGWTAYTRGFVTITDDNKRLLESESFDVQIKVGPLLIDMTAVRLFAEIVKGPSGKDRLDGTLSFESITLHNAGRSTTLEGTSVALVADYVPPELAPEGHPVLCENLCGAVTGKCEPPDDFPGEQFCPSE